MTSPTATPASRSSSAEGVSLLPQSYHLCTDGAATAATERCNRWQPENVVYKCDAFSK